MSTVNGNQETAEPVSQEWHPGIRGLLCDQARRDRFILESITLVAVLGLNLADALLTLAGYQRGLLLEANPLLVPFVDAPWLFLSIKMGTVFLGTVVLWCVRSHPWVLPASLLGFVAYGIVVAYHFYGLMAVC